MIQVAAIPLTRFCAAVFEAAGTPADVAATVADSLVYADLRGVESHGVLRMEIYLRRIGEGLVDPRAEPVLAEDGGATLLLDGRNNFGAHVGRRALRLGLERARAHGVAAVGVRRSNHFGTAAYFAEAAAREGCGAIVVSNASQTMPPHGGLRPFMGTNPFALAFPTGDGAPFVLDMATSQVARGKIIAAAKRGDSIPPGWAIDAEGRPTTDAEAALDGAVLPLGGPKGSGLSMGIDILAGVLTGAGFGPTVNNMYENWRDPQDVGHFFILIDIGRFGSLGAFAARIGQYMAWLKAEPRADGVKEILHAGEYEHRLAEERLRIGIPLPDGLVRDLIRLGERSGVAWPTAATESAAHHAA
ncbi:Ldh family oxidoreductase [uncultured Enterovirga sp.]|uniref:Ldh family oxidoreductase n=1 Tax=uncultured Enterovirga sp. TaxID=2026352 RepID=UPI0035CBB673